MREVMITNSAHRMHVCLDILAMIWVKDYTTQETILKKYSKEFVI